MRKVFKRCEIMRLKTARNMDFCSLVLAQEVVLHFRTWRTFLCKCFVLYLWDLTVHFSMPVHSRERSTSCQNWKSKPIVCFELSFRSLGIQIRLLNSSTLISVCKLQPINWMNVAWVETLPHLIWRKHFSVFSWRFHPSSWSLFVGTEWIVVLLLSSDCLHLADSFQFVSTNHEKADPL